MTLILTASVLERVADMPATIASVESAFREVGLGTAAIAAPSSMQVPGSDSCFVTMGGLSTAAGLSASKLLSDIPGNAERGLPTQRSSITLVDRGTGEVLAFLDGRVPTRVRTAAATAVATKHLARPGSSTLGFIGAGALAVAHAEAISQVLSVDTVVVWSRTAARLEEFRRAVEPLGLRVRAAACPQEVVESSDVVCTLTPATEPVVSGEWLLPGQHLNAVGARPRPTHREVDAAAMGRSRVVVDSMPTALAKSGDLLVAIEEGALAAGDVHAELGPVVAGTVPGRACDEDITLFNSVGVGLQDLAIGRLMYDGARSQGLGVDIDLGS